MNDIHEKIIYFKTLRFANTIINKALEENITINFIELNYLLFLIYAKLVREGINNEVLNERFYKTCRGPFLANLALNFNMPYEPITDYIYFDKSFMVFFMPLEYEFGKIFYNKLEEVWNLYKCKSASILEIEIKENYPCAFCVLGNKEIDPNEIFKDQGNIYDTQLNNIKTKKMFTLIR